MQVSRYLLYILNFVYVCCASGYRTLLQYNVHNIICKQFQIPIITIIVIMKKHKQLELGPLNLVKTQYRPYIGGLPGKKAKENILAMSPLQNIMLDIPQIQQIKQPIQFTTVQKLRIKISKYFQQKSIKSKDQWLFYIKKSEIVNSVNNAWTEVQTFLLKIISDLFYQLKCTNDINIELQKFKLHTLQSQASAQNLNIKSCQNSKLQQKLNRTCNVSKLDYSCNQLSSIGRNNPLRSKLLGKSQYKYPSIYTGANDIHNCTNTNSGQLAQNDFANYQQVKISKLEKEVDLYKDKIKNIEDQNKEKLKEMEKRIQIQLGIKYSQTMQEKMKYENQVESKKFYNDILAQEYNLLKKKYSQLEEQHSAIKTRYEKIQQDKNKMQGLYQYKQLWLMQYEQILQLNEEIYKLKLQRQTQINKNKGLKQKLKQLSKNFNYNYNVSMENQKDKQDLNGVLKDFRDWLKFFAVPRVSKGMMNNNTFFPQMSLDTSKQNYSNLYPKDDSTNYKLLRPNFFIYFQAYEGIILAQRKFPQRKIMPPSFYLTIRAILDAMFLHFNYTSDFKQWLSFPEFAISFIQKFEVNLQTKKPILRKSACQSQQKINFLLNIFNIQAANSWECQIFRSFIMEQFTLDELYFYLECRDQLLRGSQLNNNFGSSDSITYIKVSIAEQTIKQKLRNYDRQMLERMKKFLNSKKKLKNGRQLIDVNFVLKLLLQVYSIQKIKSQRFFHHNFKSKAPNSKISYTEYSAFMHKNFDFLTKGDIAKLYRQIYTLGVSHITYKTIHYVCSMRGLFIPLLRNKLCAKNQPHADSRYPKMFEDILFLDLQNSLNNMVLGIEEYGLQDIVDNNISINKFLHDSQKLRVNRSNFQYRLLHQAEKILKIRSILAWKNQKSFIYQQLTKDEVRQRLGYLLSIIYQSNDDVISIKKWRQARQKAIYKLTRNFKIRIQQSLAQFKVGDKKQYEIKIANVEQQISKKQDEDEETDKEADNKAGKNEQP